MAGHKIDKKALVCRKPRVFPEDSWVARKTNDTTTEARRMQLQSQGIRDIPFPSRGTEQQLLQWVVALIAEYFPPGYLGDVRRVVVTKAPSRVHDIGGWCDIEKFNQLHAGLVVNFALGLWTVVIAVELNRRGPTYYHPLDLGMDSLTLQDEEAAVLRETVAEVRERRPLRSSEEYERHYFVMGQTPPNAGLGSSASLGVALAKAVMEIEGLEHEKYTVAMIALKVESVRLNRLTGNQDQGAATFGGILAIEIEQGGFPHFKPVSLALESSMPHRIVDGTILVYPGVAGRSVSSSRRHEDVVAGIDKNDPAIIGPIRQIVDIAHRAKSRLLKGDWEGYCQLYGQNGQCQISLCDEMVTEEALQIIRLAEENGAYAKPNGAGGVIGIVAPGGASQTSAIRRKLERDLLPNIPGAMLLPMEIDYQGVATLNYSAAEVTACIG